MSETIGPAAMGSATAGKAPRLTLVVDRDGNGKPDYEEPSFWMAITTGFLGVVAAVVPGHTVVGQLARQWTSNVLPQVKK